VICRIWSNLRDQRIEDRYLSLRGSAENPPSAGEANVMRRAIANTFVVLVALAMLVGYLYGSPKYRALKKECVEAGMNHSDAPSDDDLNRLWMACRKIGYGPPLRCNAGSAELGS